MTEELAEDDLRDLYQDLILDHGKHPRNFHALQNADCEAVGHNPFCGDKLTLYLAVGDDGKIEDAAFQGDGCAISMASASMMTEMLKGKTAIEAKAMFERFHGECTGKDRSEKNHSPIKEEEAIRLRALSGVKRYPMRVKCAILAWRTLMAALDPEAGKTASTEE